jgi:glycosyltransferase involved in cell wall biosynthesis
MKIAFFFSSKNIIPPLKTGGIEQPAYYLIKELIKRKHDITLFAAPGSKIEGTAVKKIFSFPVAKKLKHSYIEERVNSFYDLGALADFFHSGESEKFDVIFFCNYIFYEILPFTRWTKTPVLIQINYPHKESYSYLKDGLLTYKNVFYTPVSNFIKKIMPELPYQNTIYPVFDINDFKYSEKGGEYLLFIGRICSDKGTHLAVQAALKANKKLVIAGEVSESNRDYFNKTVRPYIDNKKIIYVGEVDFKTKVEIYSKAIATLFTSQWDEPFGVVQLESMAAGTPVVAFKNSAVNEIVRGGVSGYIVKNGDIDAMARAANEVEKLNRRKVRQYVEEKFSIEKEADKFEKICRKIIKK